MKSGIRWLIIAVAVAAAIALGVAFKRFLDLDSCLDAGGRMLSDGSCDFGTSKPD